MADNNLQSIPRCLLEIRRPETAAEMVLWNPLQPQPIECCKAKYIGEAIVSLHCIYVNSPQNGKWRGALMFSLICVWINDWVNNREAGDLRRYCTHYDVTVMSLRDFCTWHDGYGPMVRGTWEFCNDMMNCLEVKFYIEFNGNNFYEMRLIMLVYVWFCSAQSNLAWPYSCFVSWPVLEYIS